MVISGGLGYPPFACAVQPQIRVLLFQDKDTCDLKIKGNYIIKEMQGRILNRGKDLKLSLVAQKNGIRLDKFYDSKRLKIIPADDGFYLNDRLFQGSLEIINKDGFLYIVNDLDLEEYLKGIGAQEISHYWPMEALKAQAVVFRTYAMYKMKESKMADFDLTADTATQLYKGKSAQRFRINQAVDDTKGMVLMWNDEILPAFYHSTCGGHTEDAKELWNLDILPLKGRQCGFCRRSPHYQWQMEMRLLSMEKLLRSFGYRLGRVRSVFVGGYTATGRVKTVRFLREDGSVIEIPAKQLRQMVGPQLLRSTAFEVFLHQDKIFFRGKGWGHGVGLCQWGSYFMAKEGFSFEQILNYYYPGAKIVRLKEYD